MVEYRKKNATKSRHQHKNAASHPTRGKPSNSSVEKEENPNLLGMAELTAILGQLEDGVSWYELKLKTKTKAKAKAKTNASEDRSKGPLNPEQLFNQGKALMEQQMQLYQRQKQGQTSNDDKYLATMMKSGTLADRIAAMTVAIQASPIHNIHRVLQLLAMAKKKSRRESQLAMDSLKDLFLHTYLPDDRKLHYFQAQCSTRANNDDGASPPPATLALWYLEHCIKQAFAEFLQVVETGMKDAVEHYKRCCMQISFEFLSTKPEQEQLFLSMLVNKLGDPERKIASKAMMLLQQLLKTHPVMKEIVTIEVERLLTRAGSKTERAQYNALLFMNQLYLKEDHDSDFATHLLTIYFSLFQKTIKNHKTNKHEKESDKDTTSMNSKVLSAILTGVHRVFPYVNQDTNGHQFQNELNAMFRIVHQANSFHTSVQALMVLLQMLSSSKTSSSSSNHSEDRFYTALYAKMSDPKLRQTTKHTMFFNLCFRAMKQDHSSARVQALMKRLVQLSCWMSPAFICGILLLLSEVFHHKPSLRTILEPIHAEEQQPVGIISHEALAESDDDALDAPERQHPELKEEDHEAEVKWTEALEQERLRSAEILSSLLPLEENDEDSLSNTTSTAVVSEKGSDFIDRTTLDQDDSYDATKRNPLYAHADASCFWELENFTRHYHPSVQNFARQVLAGERIAYQGDPLTDFTIAAFLDKILNKKPKPLKHTTTELASHSSLKAGEKEEDPSWSVYSSTFYQEASPQDDNDCFYQFYQEQMKRKQSQPTKKKKKKSSVHDEDDEFADEHGQIEMDLFENENEIDQYADELAQNMMKDQNYDDDEVWSLSGSDDDDDDASEPELELEQEQDSEEEEEEEEEDMNEEDRMFHDSSEDSEEDDTESSNISQPPVSKNKRKSPFVDLEEYEQMMQQQPETTSVRTTQNKKSSRRS